MSNKKYTDLGAELSQCESCGRTSVCSYNTCSWCKINSFTFTDAWARMSTEERQDYIIKNAHKFVWRV